MAGDLELWKNSVEQFEFAGDAPQKVVGSPSGIHLVLDLFENKWVVAQFAKLHEHVAQTTHSGLAAFAVADHESIVIDKLLVQLGLESGEVAFDDSFCFVR